MSTTAQVLTIIGSTAALIFAAIGIQTFWISRLIDRIDARLDRMDGRFDRVDTRLDTLTETIVREHGERITRLEERL